MWGTTRERGDELAVRLGTLNRNVVMAGLVPAIHVLAASTAKDVDARHKAGHDAVLFGG